MRTGKLIKLSRRESMVLISLRVVGQCSMLLFTCLISSVAQEYDFMYKNHIHNCVGSLILVR